VVVSARAASDGGREASANDFGGSTAYTCGGSTSADVACSSFPSGTVTFNAGDTSQTLEIFIRDDGDDTEGTTPEGFSVRLMTLGGGNAGDTALASGSTLPQTLQVDIPALRADLSVADVSAGEGENAVFVLTLLNFVGGSQTTRNVVVDYTGGRGIRYRGNWGGLVCPRLRGRRLFWRAKPPGRFPFRWCATAFWNCRRPSR